MLCREVFTAIEPQLSRGWETGHSVILVINGCDGLSTQFYSWVNLLQDFQDVDIRLRFFVDEPRVFRETHVNTVVGLLTQTLNTDEPDENPGKYQTLHLDDDLYIKQAKEALSRGFGVLLRGS